MNTSSIIRIACCTLARNKMHAALAMLGIIIGVSAVIAMVSIGQGAQASVQAQIVGMGTNLLFVSTGAQNTGVSLLVGGIGIMNIMLVSVTERTREIGIRMAIGARSTVVRTQFLIESVVLSLTGGLAGIALGLAVSFGIPLLLGWPTLVSTTSVVGSVVFSAAVGVFFGYYPARKAAALDPIEALRYE